MKNAVLEMLRCPICKASVTADETQRICRCSGQKTHSFDFSRSGYLNFGGAHAGEGDKKPAIMARRLFLDAGFYQPLAEELDRILKQISAKRIVDAGCGEGYYTNSLAKERLLLGVDLSKDGVDYAARRAKQNNTGAGFAVASVFDMPIADSAADAVLNIFAPCAEREYARVLKKDGYCILVGAGKDHLMGLKRALYEDPYINPGREDLPKQMVLEKRTELQYEIAVKSNEMIEALFSMTPYYWRTSREDRRKLESLNALTTEVHFDIFLFRKDTE